MPVYLAQVSMPAANGLSEDVVVNTFCLEGPTIVQGETLDVMTGFNEFYNFPARSTEEQATAYYINKTRSRAAGAVEVAFYDISAHLDGSPHGSPVAVDFLTLGTPHATAGSLPDEVAVALTLRGTDWQDYPVEGPDTADEDFLPERPRQRRTGRIYIGPLSTNVMTTEATTFLSRPSTEAMDAFVQCANRAFDDWNTAGYTWSVWSRKNEARVAIEQVQVDNAFDTIRRRGTDPTVRQTVTV